MASGAVTAQEVLLMAKRLGFRYGKNDKGIPALTYSSANGFVMEFMVPWLTDNGLYVYEQVCTQLNAMKQSAMMDEEVYNFLKVKGNQERIDRACLDFGMVYDSTDRRFYYVVDGKAVFGVDHDYIASMVCTGKASIDHLDDLLKTFMETAEFEHEQSAKATGKELIGRRAASTGKKGGKKEGKRKDGTGRKKKARKDSR